MNLKEARKQGRYVDVVDLGRDAYPIDAHFSVSADQIPEPHDRTRFREVLYQGQPLEIVSVRRPVWGT